MDYSKAIYSVADTISKAGKPLTEEQKMLMAGAIAIWIEKVINDEREACAIACEAQKLGLDNVEKRELLSSAAMSIRMRSTGGAICNMIGGRGKTHGISTPNVEVSGRPHLDTIKEN